MFFLIGYLVVIYTGKEYNRSALMDAWAIGGLMIVIDIFLSLT